MSYNWSDKIRQVENIQSGLDVFYSNYTTCAQRLDSFNQEDNPWRCPINPGDLALAGLFFTGSADKVQCSFCRGKLYNWRPRDIPFHEHLRNFPNCNFVRKIKQVKLNLTTSIAAESKSDILGHFPAALSLLNAGYNTAGLIQAILHLSQTETLTLTDIQEELIAKSYQQFNVSNPIRPEDDTTLLHHESPILQTDKVLELEKENIDLKIKHLCTVCSFNISNMLLLPCRHLACCQECSHNLVTCPVCNNAIVGQLKIFLA